MIYDVGSMTNAMRGKAALARRGITSYVKRREANERTGCGYVLVVPGNRPQAGRILAESGVQVVGGGDGK